LPFIEADALVARGRVRSMVSVTVKRVQIAYASKYKLRVREFV